MLLSGLLLGMGSAIGGGLSNLAVTLATRRIGSLRTLAGAQVSGLVLLVAVGVITGVTLPLGGSLLPMSLGVALISTTTYLAFFVALRLGPVAIVSPIVGAYGGIVVVFAVIVLGEAISLAQAAAVVAATIGVILSSVTLGAARRIGLVGPGVAFAFIAVVGFAANVTSLAGLIRDNGWLAALIVWRFWMVVVSMGLVALVVLVGRSRSAGRAGTEAAVPAGVPRRRLERDVAAYVVVGGLLDVAATICLSIGLEVSSAWLVGLVSSLGPMSGVLAGVFVFSERLTRVQLIGLGLVGVSLVALALG